MYFLEIGWEIEVPEGSCGWIMLCLDDEWGDENGNWENPDPYVSSSGSFKLVVDESQQHDIQLNLYCRDATGGPILAKITKIMYGALDLLAVGSEFWSHQGDGTLRFEEGYLLITCESDYDDNYAVGLTEPMEQPPLEISFDWEVSSEENYDFFSVYIDEFLVFQRSGLFSGTFTTHLPDSEYLIRFEYAKDSSYAENEDCARVSNIFVGDRDLLTKGLEGWDLGGDVPPNLEDGKIVLACSDNQFSFAEIAYVPGPNIDITSVRIRYFKNGQQINQIEVEALDTFDVDALVEYFNLVIKDWVVAEPVEVSAEIQVLTEEGFERISESIIHKRPANFFKLVQKCDGPPGVYYLKTNSVIEGLKQGEFITQIERLKIKAKVII